jgi:YesN/AraC family two-component response regulator
VGSYGREAIEAAEAHRPDIVILDISMPVMNGLEVNYWERRKWNRRNLVSRKRRMH